MAINYYEMLGLSAEKFENDQTKIEAVYNATIKKWNSSKSLSEQNKAKLHGSKIKEAFSDPEEWKRQYEEYRKKTNENIQVLLDNVKSNGKVPEKSIDTIADASIMKGQYMAEPILSFPIGQAAKNYISIFAKVGNDYLPIGKTIIEANLVQQRKMIKYEFSWGFKSGVWITGINDRYIPNINIIGKRGSIPPRDINDGEAIYRISSGMIGPNPIFFNVKPKRGVSYKLFTDNTDYLLIVSGPTHRD